MSVSYSQLYSYLTQKLRSITDEALRKKEDKIKPVVGIEKGLRELILMVDKGFFAIMAHTGGGKTTFALSIYHDAKQKIIPYDVIYVDMRSLMEELRKRRFQENPLSLIYDIIRHPGKYKEYRGIYTTINRDLVVGRDGKTFDLEDLKQISSQGIRLLVFIDEMEKIMMEIPSNISLLANMAKILRTYYTSSGLIPLKVIVMYPRVIEFDRQLKRAIEDLGYDVKVFTEFRQLKITGDIITSYIENLESYLKDCGLKKYLFNKGRKRKSSKKSNNEEDHIIDKPTIDDLRKLSILENGRFIFPIVRDVIVKGMLYVIYNAPLNQEDRNKFFSEIADLLSKIKGVDYIVCNDLDKRLLSLINSSNRVFKKKITDFVHKELVSILEDKYYAVKSGVRESLYFWTDAIVNLLREYLGFRNLSIISRNIGHIIIHLENDLFIWFALKKKLTSTDFEKTIYKISNSMGYSIPSYTSRISKRGNIQKKVNIIVLKPETTTGRFINRINKGSLVFEFKQVLLTKSEIISIMGLSSLSRAPIEQNISHVIASQELAPKIKEAIRLI